MTTRNPADWHLPMTPYVHYELNILFAHNVLRVPSGTPVQNDAAQYMIRHGQKQYNLCGEFCVAYCMQDEAHTDNIDAFLDYWQAKELTWYQSAFRNGLARTTSIHDLIVMLGAYGVNAGATLQQVSVNASSFEHKLQSHQAIIGVQIDYTGYLVGKGIPHWVVLDGCYAVGTNHGVVRVYNPFTNNEELFTWRELMNSTGAYKRGIWIER